MTNDIKEVCRKFESATGMRVVVQERAGQSVKLLAKAEPLKNQGCVRTSCFPCSTGGGQCEKNGVSWQESQHYTKEKQQGMHLLEGSST